MELIGLFHERHPEVMAQVAPTAEGYSGYGGRRLLSPSRRSGSSGSWATSWTRTSS